VLLVDGTWRGNLWEPFTRSDYVVRDISCHLKCTSMCLKCAVSGDSGDVSLDQAIWVGG
jgi:hypothetical protein